MAKLTVKWDGALRIRLKPDHQDDFGELLGAEVNGFDLILRRHRSGKYYQARLGRRRAAADVGRWSPRCAIVMRNSATGNTETP